MLSPTSSLQANHEHISGVDQDDLYAAPAAVHSEQQPDDSLSTSSQLAGAERESDAHQSEVEDSDHTGELQRLLAEERKKTAALIGKFPQHVSCTSQLSACSSRVLCARMWFTVPSYAMLVIEPRPCKLLKPGHAS